MKSVRVVIPIYKSELSELELKLLRHNLEQLRRYRIILVAPIFLDISKIVAFISSNYIVVDLDVIRVSTRWLGLKNGVDGYNKMMLSESFYELFSDTEYILICQLDTIIFKGDELRKWCGKGYDYVAAPWLKKKRYNNFFVKLFVKIKSILIPEKSIYKREEILGRIGNGGLSLRKVSSFINGAKKYREIAEKFCENEHHNLNNEDVFWAMVPEEFSYPTYEEAFHFSIDTNPEESMNMLQSGSLPFGCHGLNNAKIYSYWHELLMTLL